MATKDYGPLAATATRLIDQFGRSATLVSMTPGTGYDPGEPTESNAAVRIVAWDYRQSERDGTLIQMNDRRVMMDATATPVSQDRLVDGSDEFVVVNVEAIKPGPTALAYIVQLRA